MDFFSSAPPTTTVRLESVPAGADAKTSLGPGCKTPCSVQVPASGNFTVTFALDKYEPVTVPVTATPVPGQFGGGSSSVTTDPNPVFAELAPAAPPKKAKRPAPKKKKPAAAAPAAAPADSAFPPPTAPAR
jgi:hypothetical protein